MKTEPYEAPTESDMVCPRTGKERLTRREAMNRARWWRQVRLARMKHYHCKHCGDWHIGNNRRKPRQR